ncbi:FtsX-like permease family protein [Maribellus comscasis]|uniref:FtsX-like permease family protein n=1 Tax=Maribellus comscasis TaxID=2681766 RepID=A0A6I6JWX6_9BACT|nr:ABC transporter permease [Maribellus comscasis]QGY44647.1 FtsX-like permease family protein [Maribellus comscasis]
MKNVIKLILRNLLRKPVTTGINLLGLSVSLALVIILSAYSYSEFTTDNFHKNHENIYLIQPLKDWFYTPGILKPIIDANIAGVKKSIRMRDKWNPPVYQVENEDPVISDLIFSDNDFFDLFDYTASEGNLKTALGSPMSVVISKPLATRLFGNQSAVGKLVKIDNKHLLTVTAVLKEQPSNTMFSFNSIANIETMKRVQSDDERDFTTWGWKNYQTFLLLDDKANPSSVQSQVIKLFPEEEQKKFVDLNLVPLDNIYFSFHNDHHTFIKSGNKTQVILLSVVAFLILVVALVNFINISTTQWRDQIKQTGILKVIGAKRTEIMLKMLFETFLQFTFAFLFACLMTYIVTPILAHETTITFNPLIIYSGKFLIISLACIFVLSLLCSIVPALRIASSETLINLKKKIVFKHTKSLGKGTLVSAQFVVAIILILFTILIQKQVDFGSSNLGMNQENIVGIELTDQLAGKKDVLKDELLAQANIEEVIFTQYYPGKMNSGWGLELQQNSEKKQVEFRTFSADAGFFDIMGLQLLKGRFYSDDLESDKHKVIVNEQFCRKYGITDPIGAIMPRGNGPDYEIVGLVKDFHFRPINETIAPLAIRNDNYASIALVKLKTENFKALRNTFENIQSMTAELSPSFPVKVSFFSQAVEHLYQEEVKFRKAFTLFAVCAVVISCMGILAMSMFAAQNRIKEIGIRKVNGAKISEILTMLNKDFVRWVVIAFVVATPISYYSMNKWLENFAYKTNLSWWIFALTGVLALGIALLTVSWQSWRAATRNPVEALRYE